MNPIISIQNLSFAYNTENVLENINLEINSGDFVGIIGPNGGGKTTLLRLILGLGLLKPQKGTIKLFNTNINQFKQWDEIGYVPQKATQLDSKIPITVEEIVLQGRTAKRGIFNWFTKKDKTAADEALSSVNMLQYKDRKIYDLSGGQQQRVFIARALASEPELLILDEPTVGVDIQTQDEFYQLLSQLNNQNFCKQHNREKLTLVIVSHDIDVIVNEVTTLACLNKTLIYEGTPKQFIKEDYLEKLYGKQSKFIIHNH